MGYMWAMGACFRCHRVFSFNPELVPSIRVNAQGEFDPNGSREPVCAACVRAVNPRRIRNGLEPIRPLPGAYEPEECE